MALIGNIGQFDYATEHWSSYKERLEQCSISQKSIERRRRENHGAGGTWGGGISLPTGDGPGEGAQLCPLPNKFWNFFISK